MQLSPDILSRIWILAGPTAAGKSSVGLELAERIGAEIVCLDSMTLYRRMDIGTAKPTADDRGRIPHHLLDLLEPHQEFSLSNYVEQAAEVCEEILNRGSVPLFVGGTGLYLRGLLRGVFDGPPADWNVRTRLEEIASKDGNEALHQMLEQVDPATAARLPPQDIRRIIRALEVYELTGQPLSAQQTQGPAAHESRPPVVVWLSAPRDWLYSRINRRVDEMLEEGWLDEVRELDEESPGLGKTASQALGYGELREFLHTGGDWSETVDRIKTRTRQFAKRQHTWFRNLEECQPLEIAGTEAPAEIAQRLIDLRSNVR